MTNEWKITKLGDLLQKTEFVDPKKEPQAEFKYIDVSSINNKNFQIESTTLLKGKDAPSRARKLVRTNDVIFATVRPTLKRIAIIPEELDGQICSTGFFVLRAKEVNNKLFYYYLQTDVFLSAMEKLQRGASYPAVTDSDIKDQLFSFPSSQYEQNRIVQLLDHACSAINKATANVESNLQNSKDLFKGYLRNAFKAQGKPWRKGKLGEVCSFVRGPFGGSLKKNIFKSDGYAVYEQQHAIYDQFEDVRYFIDENKFNEMKRFELIPSDLIMSCSGTMGRIAIVPENIKRGIINQALLKITPAVQLLNEFLKFWMQSDDFQNSLKEYSGGAAIQNVASVSILKNIELPIPSLEQQKHIVINIKNILSETEKLESADEKKLDALADLKKTILQKAFSGELTAATKNLIT
jgi:type I restriction enzyme, S subunit